MSLLDDMLGAGGGPLEPLIFGYRTILRGATQLARRARVRFDPNVFTVTDNQTDECTDIGLTAGGGGGAPAGSDLWYQFNNDGALGATANLQALPTDSETLRPGTLLKGKTLHQESVVVFRSPNEPSDLSLAPTYGEARSYFGSGQTPDATPRAISTVDISTDVFGNFRCKVSVTVSAVTHAGTGGTLERTFEVARHGATLVVDADADQVDTTTKTPDLAFAITGARVDDDSFAIMFTGIAATLINYEVVSHVRITIEPQS